MADKKIRNKNVKSASSLEDAMINMASKQEEAPVQKSEQGSVGEEQTNTEEVEVELQAEETSEDTVEDAEENEETTVEAEEQEEVISKEETEEEEEKTSEPEIIDDWDTESPEEDKTEEKQEPKFSKEDYEKQLAETLGVDLQDGADITQSIKNQLEKVKEDVLDGVPEDLKKAVELAKKGADYQEYLSVNNVDFDSIPDVDLYANAVAGYFQKEDGSLDDEALQKHVDEVSDVDLKFKADQVRAQLKATQNAKVQELEAQAQKRFEQREAAVDSALKDFKSVSGFKVNPYQKEEIRKSIVDDTLVKDLFYSDGKFSEKKAIDAAFKIRNFDKIVNYLKTKNRNEGKRQIVETMSNVDKRSAKGEAVGKQSSRSPQKLTPQQLFLQDIKSKYNN